MSKKIIKNSNMNDIGSVCYICHEVDSSHIYWTCFRGCFNDVCIECFTDYIVLYSKCLICGNDIFMSGNTYRSPLIQQIDTVFMEQVFEVIPIYFIVLTLPVWACLFSIFTIITRKLLRGYLGQYIQLRLCQYIASKINDQQGRMGTNRK